MLLLSVTLWGIGGEKKQPMGLAVTVFARMLESDAPGSWPYLRVAQ